MHEKCLKMFRMYISNEIKPENRQYSLGFAKCWPPIEYHGGLLLVLRNSGGQSFYLAKKVAPD